jgi:hypothetical protein
MPDKKVMTKNKAITLIEYAMIAAGGFALLGFGGIAYYSFTQKPATITTATPENFDAASIIPAEMEIPPASALNGGWQTQTSYGSATVLLLEDMYEIIYKTDESNPVQRYSRGFFTYNETDGKMTLTPDPRAGAPNAISGVIFKSLARTPFDLFVKQKSGVPEIYWMPPESMIASRQIHPLFHYMNGEGTPVLKWLPAPKPAAKP